MDNAHAQLEHQYNRIQNLELLLKYGDKVRVTAGSGFGCRWHWAQVLAPLLA